jgi:hypothetical protein
VASVELMKWTATLALAVAGKMEPVPVDHPLVLAVDCRSFFSLSLKHTLP